MSSFISNVTIACFVISLHKSLNCLIIVLIANNYLKLLLASLKSFFEGIGVLISVISLGFVAMKPELLPDLIRDIPVSYFAGAFTHYICLIGANICRAVHFGYSVNIGRIVLYGMIIIGLIILRNKRLNAPTFSRR